MATSGASYATKSIYLVDMDKFLKLELWDTAGQEKYRSLSKIFYKDANVALLCYDIARKNTFEEVKIFWANQVKENTKRLKLILVANKTDMLEYAEVNEKDARSYAKENGFIYKEASAKTNSGIEDLFLTIGKEFLNKPELDRSVFNSAYIKNHRISAISQKESNRKKAEEGGCCK